MKCLIIFFAFVAMALARPGHLFRGSHYASHVVPFIHAAPQTYVESMQPAPIGQDGRVVDTPEVAQAKAEHAAAHAHEKSALAHEAHKSADHLTYATNPYHNFHAYHTAEPVTYTNLGPPAPIGHDGRVIDTPEVARAKAAHFAAHEEAKAALHSVPEVHLFSTYASGTHEPYYGHQW